MHIPACAGLVQVAVLHPSAPPDTPCQIYIHSRACLGQAEGMGCSHMGILPGMEVASLFNLYHHLLGCAFADFSP